MNCKALQTIVLVIIILSLGIVWLSQRGSIVISPSPQLPPSSQKKQVAVTRHDSDLMADYPMPESNLVQTPLAEPKMIRGEKSAIPRQPQIASAPITPIKSKKPELVDPQARMALAFVGVDPSAEAYWLDAINDPNLPASERQDLIEDLNEVGLGDPKHPGEADLPVIISRMQLLQGLEAMDKVNADAMEEAYKDLLNLAQLASGRGGKPVN